MFNLFSRNRKTEAPVDAAPVQLTAHAERRSLADPTELDFSIFGIVPSLSGATVTPASALRVPAVSAGVKAISEAVGILPLHAYRKDAFKGFITDLVNAKSPAEALLGALNKLSAKLLDMALDALWERIFGPSRGNNIFSTWGKGLATPAPASSIASTPISTTPVTTVPAELKPLANADLRGTLGLDGKPASIVGGDLRGSLGIDGAALAKTVQPAMQDAASGFAKSITLTPKEITDLKKTLMTEWVTKQGDAQGKGIIDTILNRRASGKWGDSVTDVVNARKQFSDVNGPPAWKHGRRSVDDLSVNDPRYARASRLVDEYLPQRAAGTPSIVGDHLNYANRAQSDAVNHRWIDTLDGPKLGAHRHGTTADLQRFRPGEYGINLPGQSMLAGTPDPMTTGSIAQQQLAAQQEQIVQQQIEAQRRLQQQMQATATSTTAMQQPLPAANKGKTPLTLVAGGHRLRGGTINGWEEIDAIVVSADAVEAQLLELSENLYRNELSALDRAMFVLKFRELWEEKHGKIDPKGGRPSKQGTECPVIFVSGRELSKQVQERLGFGETTYKKVTRIGQNLHPDLRALIRGTGAEDDQSLLLKLAKKGPSEQAGIVRELRDGKNLKAVLAGVKADKPKLEPQEEIFQKVALLLEKADDATLLRVLHHIGDKGDYGFLEAAE